MANERAWGGMKRTNDVKAKSIDSKSEHLVVRQGIDEHASGENVDDGVGKCILSTTISKNTGAVRDGLSWLVRVNRVVRWYVSLASMHTEMFKKTKKRS